MAGLITFEGGEGAGKSTLIQALACYLQSKEREVVVTREPGGSEVAEKLRDLLLQPSEPLDIKTELLLFLAARAHHVATLLNPSLAAGKLILCDRFTESTLAYQGYGRGLDLDFLTTLCQFTSSIRPDLIFYLDVAPAVGLQRLSATNRFDREDVSFHEKVRSGFLELAKKNPKIVILDATQPAELIYQQSLRYLDRWLT